ncbi:MAG: PEP-CTERM sorting domain-containing protein, partial [Desulfohalobiaceae bacterium]|nr:PEP-CTERM sorting domain-containing protein [Desulfohalobiaceae bacterium]
DCGDPAAVTTLNHNLGANEAAYALFSPELNGGLADWLGQGYDVLSMSIFLDELSNGYEQIFLQSSTVQPIPEPTTMLLLGTGLLGLIGFSRRFKKR